MSVGPSAHRYDFDFVRDISNEINRKEDLDNYNNIDTKAKCPHIRMCIDGKCVTALLDSGSQVSAVSEWFYRELVSKNSVQELPVNNLMVSTAIGRKSTPIRRQIFITSQIEDMIFAHLFVVVPYLTSNIINGHDWLVGNEVILDYKRNSIEIRGKVLKSSSVVFKRGTSEICVEDKGNVYVEAVNAQDLNENSKETSNVKREDQIEDRDEKLKVTEGKDVQGKDDKSNFVRIDDSRNGGSSIERLLTEKKERKNEISNAVVSEGMNSEDTRGF